MTRAILIASDASPGSDGAVLVGLAIARAHAVEAEIVTVMQPPSPYLYGEVGVPQAYTMLQAAGAEDLRAAVTAQVERVGAGGSWRISVETGPAARTIARFARLRGVGSIVAGTGPRHAVERWLRSDTALKIVQLATVPVLLVPPTATEPPTSALVAIDFSEFSLAAARAAVEVVGRDGRIVLVHVAWAPAETRSVPSLEEYWKTYGAGAKARLEALASELRNEGSARVEAHVATGEAAPELLACATRFNVDLVAAGSHGQGFLGRLVMGSVSTSLIHGARHAVLIVPPTVAPEEFDPGETPPHGVDRLAE